VVLFVMFSCNLFQSFIVLHCSKKEKLSLFWFWTGFLLVCFHIVFSILLFTIVWRLEHLQSSFILHSIELVNWGMYHVCNTAGVVLCCLLHTWRDARLWIIVSCLYFLLYKDPILCSNIQALIWVMLGMLGLYL
jgi:hypothetical protein